MKYALLFLLGLGAALPVAYAQPAASSAPAAPPAPAAPTAMQQRYVTAAGQTTFFSTAPIEDIEALNSRVEPSSS